MLEGDSVCRYFILYLTVWGVEPAVTHQISWLESTGKPLSRTTAIGSDIEDHPQHRLKHSATPESNVASPGHHPVSTKRTTARPIHAQYGS